MDTATLSRLAIVDSSLENIPYELPPNASFKDLANVLLAPVDVDASLSVLQLLGFADRMPKYSGRIFLAIELKLIQHKADIEARLPDIKSIPEEQIEILNNSSPLRGELNNVIQLLGVFRESTDLNARPYDFRKINTTNMSLIKGYIQARVGLMEGNDSQYIAFATLLKSTFPNSNSAQKKAITHIVSMIKEHYKDLTKKTSTITLPQVTFASTSGTQSISSLSVDIIQELNGTDTLERLEALKKMVISRMKGLDDKTVNTKDYLLGLIQKKRDSLGSRTSEQGSGLRQVMDNVSRLIDED